MFKKYVKIIIIAVVVLVFANTLKDFILKRIVILGGSQAVGAKVSIGRVSWSIFRQKLFMRNMKIYNPAGFPGEPLIDIATIDMHYKFGSLFKSKPTLDLMDMNVREIVVIKDKDKKVNVNELKIAKEASKGGSQNAAFPMQIDLLKLNIDQVVFKDYSKEESGVITTHDIGLKDKKFKNVKSAGKLVTTVLVNALSRTSLKGVKLYALAAFAGPAFLPAGITGVLISKSHADGEFEVSFEKAYSVALSVLKDIGEVSEENIETGVIEANVSGHEVSIKVDRVEEKKVKVTATAKKLKIPKPQFAGGILYQIGKELE